MLKHLQLHRFTGIEQLELVPQEGFNAITGASGAGKSILLDALGASLGAKSRLTALAKAGSSITSIWEPSESVKLYLKEHGFDDSTNELVIRRTLDASGKSRYYLNGQLSSASDAEALSTLLCTLYTQRHSQKLLTKSGQCEALDELMNLSALRQGVFDAYGIYKSHLSALERAQKHSTERHQERMRLMWEYELLQEASAQPGAFEAINQEHKEISVQLADAHEYHTLTELIDAPDGIEPLLQTLYKRALKVGSLPSGIKDTLSSILDQMQTVSFELSRMIPESDELTAKQEALSQQMELYLKVARKLKLLPEQLAERTTQVQEQLAQLEQAADLPKIEQALAQSLESYKKLDKALSAARKSAAVLMETSAHKILAELGMGNTQIKIHQTVFDDPRPYGQSSTEIQFKSSEHLPWASLEKSASGGELARVCLALILSAPAAQSQGLVVFDEVDVGVGGTTAQYIGELLSALGQKVQVLCITHLAPVACYANAQHEVVKDAQSVPSTRLLGSEGRIKELARMLGDPHAQSAQAHAQTLLLHAQAFLEAGDTDPLSTKRTKNKTATKKNSVKT